MDNNGYAREILQILQNLDPPLKMVSSAHGGYLHIGATLTDLVLQPHFRKYASQVTPVVKRLQDQYPGCATVSAFISAMEETSPKYFLNLTDGQRARQVYAIAQYLDGEGVETEEKLAAWIRDPEKQRSFKQQRGMTARSLDYLRVLLGEDCVPVDHSIRPLLNRAGVPVDLYAEAQQACEAAYARMNVSARVGYLSCWKYWMAHRWPSP